MPGGLIAPPNQGVGSLIGNRYPTGPEPEQPMGNSGVSILMDLIRKLMEEGDYQGLSKVLPQMYPDDELGAPPGPVLPEPTPEETGEYGEPGLGGDYGEIGDYGGLLPEELQGLLGGAPPPGGSWPQYPLEEGPNVWQYTNPSVSELPGMLAGDQGFALPLAEPAPGGFTPGAPMGDTGFAPPVEPLFGPGGFTGAPPDMRQPGPIPELDPEILMLLGLLPQGQM